MVNAQSKRIVAERAEGRCEYCLCPADHTPDDFAAEHIFPRSRGGSDDLDNLAWSCQGCNSRKFTATQAVDPQTGRRVSLYHPRRHTWSDHFRWSDDLLTLLGLTPSGRATIVRLDLNRYNVVNLRLVLIPFGKHPS
jgi:hypothetical protein